MRQHRFLTIQYLVLSGKMILWSNYRLKTLDIHPEMHGWASELCEAVGILEVI